MQISSILIEIEGDFTLCMAFIGQIICSNIDTCLKIILMVNMNNCVQIIGRAVYLTGKKVIALRITKH